MIQTVVEVEFPVEERLRIQKNRIEPAAGSNGRRISIVTGIHGDELEGQYVCFAVQQRLRRHPEYLRGTVDIYPAMNPLGIDSVTRVIICGRKYYGHISRIVKSEDFLSLRAERAGFFQPFVRPGEQVGEGQRGHLGPAARRTAQHHHRACGRRRRLCAGRADVLSAYRRDQADRRGAAIVRKRRRELPGQSR